MNPPPKKPNNKRKQRKPRCKSCTQLRKELKTLKSRNKELDIEADRLYNIVDTGSEFIKLLVAHIDEEENGQR